jgi:hypothetical protein
MVSEVSSGLVVRNSKILMFFDEETEKWNVPSDSRASGELSADTAARAVKSAASCGCKVSRYRKRFKIEFESQGEQTVWQPYSVELEETPEKGEWVHVSELGKKELAEPLTKIKDKMADML